MYRLPYQCPTGELGSIVLFDEHSPGINDDYTIETRAWTLQEDLLSTRIIQFGSYMLWWSCSHGVKGNGGKYHQFTPKNRRLSGDSKKAMEEWKSIVKDYTDRKMTNESDKFNAIAAIAAEVAQILKKAEAGISATYVAGLWETDLSAQLLWHTHYGSRLQQIPKSYRAPSWSWGSVDDNIRFWDSNSCLHGDLRWQIDLENEMLPYGQAKGGFLAVIGLAKKAMWVKGRECIQDEDFPNAGLGNVASTMSDYLQDTSSDSPNIEVWCLAMAKSYQFSQKRGSAAEKIAGLILRPLGSPGQSIPINISSLRTAMSNASVLKGDGVYWDRSCKEPILRHTDMTLDPDQNSEQEIFPCESHLFRRVGFFELKYDRNVVAGWDEDASESKIAEEKGKMKWFEDCPAQLVYIV